MQFIEIHEEKLFSAVHAALCQDDNAQSTQISGSHEPPRYQCDVCGCEEQTAGEHFDSEASPIYDDDGRKTGSGEYRQIEFIGYVPNTPENQEVVDGVRSLLKASGRL